jgi:hypothetical protein
MPPHNQNIPNDPTLFRRRFFAAHISRANMRNTGLSRCLFVQFLAAYQSLMAEK